MVLDAFGLSAAIEDVCQQLQDGVKFTCSVKLGNLKMDKYFELAVYRTAQELMLNVIKHAEATRANTDIRMKGDKIMIRVEDDGNGQAMSTTDKTGIGLASIRNKANLLGGSVNITSVLGKGTIVEVWLAVAGYKI